MPAQLLLDSVKYRQLLMQTLAQLNSTNAMIAAVKDQANELGAAGELDKVPEQERLAMHFDMKATMLLQIVATYEVAYQAAIANERAVSAIATAGQLFKG